MLIMLLVFEIMLAILIIFTTSMVENKYKEIDNSLKLYGNNRAYKTAEKVDFISRVIERYKVCIEDTDETPNIDSIVKNYFYKEYIGRFTYIGVKNVATKTYTVMWGGIFLEVIIALVNKVTTEYETIVIIVSSILLTMLIQVFSVVKGLEEKKESLLIAIDDYVLHTYPIKEKKKAEHEEVIKLKSKLQQLENQINSKEKSESNEEEGGTHCEKINRQAKALEERKLNENTKKAELSAQDIEKFIGIF